MLENISRATHRFICELPVKQSEVWRKAEIKQDAPSLWILCNLRGIFVFLMGWSKFTYLPVPSRLYNRLYTSLTAEVYVNDSTNPCLICPRLLFCHGTNIFWVLAGVLAEKKYALCNIHHGHLCQHVSPR